MVSCRKKKPSRGKKTCKFVLIYKKLLSNYQSSPHFKNLLISSMKRLSADFFVFIRFFLGRIGFSSHVPPVQTKVFVLVQSKLLYYTNLSQIVGLKIIKPEFKGFSLIRL